jgi:hypothetical protein
MRGIGTSERASPFYRTWNRRILAHITGVGKENGAAAGGAIHIKLFKLSPLSHRYPIRRLLKPEAVHHPIHDHIVAAGVTKATSVGCVKRHSAQPKRPPTNPIVYRDELHAAPGKVAALHRRYLPALGAIDVLDHFHPLGRAYETAFVGRKPKQRIRGRGYDGHIRGRLTEGGGLAYLGRPSRGESDRPPEGRVAMRHATHLAAEQNVRLRVRNLIRYSQPIL